MIVVIGNPLHRASPNGVTADGLAARIALAASEGGGAVQIVGKIGDDPAGDELLLALGRSGVGHVATLRDPSRGTVVLPPPPDHDPIDVADEPSADATSSTPRDDGAPALEVADVQLALRYLPDARVIVAVHASTAILAEAAAAATWSEAHLVAVVEPGADTPTGLPAEALVVSALPDDAEGFASRIGQYAAAVARGDDPAVAFAALTAAGTA